MYPEKKFLLSEKNAKFMKAKIRLFLITETKYPIRRGGII
jgi:hypothetical protein